MAKQTIEQELIAALKDAIRCVQWCRKCHADEQSGEGVPTEAIWLELIARAEGRETSTEDFLLNSLAAIKGELVVAA